MSQEISRLTAYKLPIKVIINSKFVKGEEGVASSYIEVNNQKVGRVNLIGIILSVDNNYIIIDDGTGKIQVRFFEENNKQLNVGEIILVIGRPREFNSERYVAPEIINKTNEKWMQVRKKEIGMNNFENNEIKEEEPAEEETISPNTEERPYDKLLRYIKTNDEGKGVDIEAIISKAGVEDSEKIIDTMVKEGEIFEHAPGKVKILE